jgi:hypothetical protein
VHLFDDSVDWARSISVPVLVMRPVTRLSDLLGQPTLDTGHEVVVPVESLRGQLQSIHQGSERGMTTPAGEPCTKTTTGAIIPAPVTIVGQKITGKESHRLAERQTGLTPVAGETQVFAQTKPPPAPAPIEPPRPCQKPGCPDLVTGRRLWCRRHAQASSVLKRRWRAARMN